MHLSWLSIRFFTSSSFFLFSERKKTLILTFIWFCVCVCLIYRFHIIFFLLFSDNDDSFLFVFGFRLRLRKEKNLHYKNQLSIWWWQFQKEFCLFFFLVYKKKTNKHWNLIKDYRFSVWIYILFICFSRFSLWLLYNFDPCLIMKHDIILIELILVLL